MKKLLLLVSFAIITLVSTAQLNLNVGAHFMANSTWLINKQVFDESSGMSVRPTFGTSWGLVARYDIFKILGVEVDINFNTVVQKYKGSMDFGFWENPLKVDFNSDIKYKSVDIPVLVRLGGLAYVEAGLVFQFVSKVKYNYSMEFEDESISTTDEDISDWDVKSTFKSSGVGAAFGFGFNIGIIPNKLKLDIGLRVNYIFTDMKGINGLGQIKESLSVKQADKFKTNPLYGGLKVGLTYKF